MTLNPIATAALAAGGVAALKGVWNFFLKNRVNAAWKTLPFASKVVPLLVVVVALGFLAWRLGLWTIAKKEIV